MHINRINRVKSCKLDIQGVEPYFTYANKIEASMKKLLLMVPLLIASCTNSGTPTMSQTILEKTIKSIASNSTGGNGVVKFSYNNVKMVLISDIAHDRMRIIAPVVKLGTLTREHVDAALESNFHKSLDARYAVSNGILYSAYIHPLSALNKKQIKSAMLQVSNLAISFGSEYSSGILTFGGKKEVKRERIKDGAI